MSTARQNADAAREAHQSAPPRSPSIEAPEPGVAVAEGLEGVVVTRTRTSLVDGARGRLVIAGRDVEALAREGTYESAVAALFRAVGEERWTSERIERAFAEGRQRAFSLVPRLDAALRATDAMDALRGSVAALPPELAAEPAWLAAATSVFVAAHARLSAGLPPRPPDPARGHAADLLAMLTGANDPARARALDRYLVTVLDHGLNASTFAARVVASTGSDLVSAVAAATGALKGPLHGGAPGPVLDMLDAIGRPERAASWLASELEAGRRIMGMGHRVYRVRDPRAAVLEEALSLLSEDASATPRLALARAVERAAEDVLQARYPERSLSANVEFYTAVLLDAVGVPRTHFSAVFAAGRVAGWCAHYAEQRREGRLIRPDALYVGPMPP